MRYSLRLYVAGHSPNSVRAISGIKSFLEERASDQYELQIVDVLKSPAMAEGDNIIATPTLCKLLPLPEVRMVGDLTDRERLADGLELMAGLDGDE